MADRADPMVAAAQIIVAVRDAAAARSDARATVGRLTPVPGGTNVIASRVDMWLDARHPDDAVTAGLIESVSAAAQDIASREGCFVSLTEESYSDTVHFDPGLSRQIGNILPGAPVLATGAGHDAGVLAGYVPSAMLFVRNPSGISHSPEEYVADEDADAGAVALAEVLGGLL
jgi:N-carbamoyl-L-amino-acid hydrolase